MGYQIKLLPEGKIITAEHGQNLLKVLHNAGIMVESTCGGKGRCRKCKVRIKGKNETQDREVISCLTEIESDLEVILPEKVRFIDRKSRLLDTSKLETVTSIKKVFYEIPKPSLEDQRGDLDRVLETAGLKGKVSLALSRKVSQVLRENNFAVTLVIRGDELLDIEGGDTSAALYGVAFDIGTTTMVCSLFDYQAQKVLATLSATNPQRKHGGDVISRITFANEEPGNLELLQKEVIGGLNELLEQACKQAGVNPQHIYYATVVGNTCMNHLFLGLNPQRLALAPYVPVIQRPVEVKAEELGLAINSAGFVYALPNIAGFVGADTVGVILSTRLYEATEPILAIDLGTNGEIVLNSGEKMIACSTAAGPAFEGAQITFGMRAAQGAIESVELDGSYRAKVIGGGPIKGICGSGLIDVVAKLVKIGVIDERGRINGPENLPAEAAFLKDRLISNGASYDFVLAKEDESADGQLVLLTQKDIRELQLAKGAILAGVKILLKEAGLKVEDLSQVYLAGAFGSYVDVESALGIGLLPNIPAQRVRSVGNAAGLGSLMALASEEEREKAAELARQVEYIELSTRLDFQDEFMAALNFPVS